MTCKRLTEDTDTDPGVLVLSFRVYCILFVKLSPSFHSRDIWTHRPRACTLFMDFFLLPGSFLLQISTNHSPSISHADNTSQETSLTSLLCATFTAVCVCVLNNVYCSSYHLDLLALFYHFHCFGKQYLKQCVVYCKHLINVWMSR